MFVSKYLLDKNYTTRRSHCDITSLKEVQTSRRVLIPVECVLSLSNRLQNSGHDSSAIMRDRHVARSLVKVAVERAPGSVKIF